MSALVGHITTEGASSVLVGVDGNGSVWPNCTNKCWGSSTIRLVTSLTAVLVGAEDVQVRGSVVADGCS